MTIVLACVVCETTVFFDAEPKELQFHDFVQTVCRRNPGWQFIYVRREDADTAPQVGWRCPEHNVRHVAPVDEHAF